MVLGFEEDTLGVDLERVIGEIENKFEISNAGDKKASGYRGSWGTLKFNNKDDLDNFLEKTRSPFTITHQDNEYKLNTKVFIPKRERVETKEPRTLAYVLRTQMKFNERNRTILDMDFRLKTVLLNNKRIAEFVHKNSGKVRGRVDRAVHSFKLDIPEITKQAAAVGYPVEGSTVAETYESIMRS